MAVSDLNIPAFNALDEAIVQGRLDKCVACRVKNVTSEVTSFHGNRRQTQLISDLFINVIQIQVIGP